MAYLCLTMVKRIISLLVLLMYLHGISGYTMSFHKCNITGFEKVYTSYSKIDPCGEMGGGCKETTPHFERGRCCDVQHTVICVDDDSNTSSFKSAVTFQAFVITNPLYFLNRFTIEQSVPLYDNSYLIRPPDPSVLCTFRI